MRFILILIAYYHKNPFVAKKTYFDQVYSPSIVFSFNNYYKFINEEIK